MSLQIGMLAKMNVSSVALLGWGWIVMVSYDSGRGELYLSSDLFAVEASACLDVNSRQTLGAVVLG